MTYKPYRKPAPSTARGPQLLPDRSTTYSFTSEQITARSESSLLSLAAETGRLIAKLGMPETVHFELPGESLPVKLKQGEVPVPEDKSFYIKMKHESAVVGDEYEVDASICGLDGVTDAVRYTVWRPQRDGFVVPWGAHVREAQRTAYPRFRAGSISEKSSRILPTTPINGLRVVIHDLVYEKYPDAQQIEPPLEPLVTEDQYPDETC